MKVGLSIPRLPDSDAIRRFVKRAEELGFESMLAGDHVVLPTGGTNQYPYTADGSFSRPSDEPFLETMTMLGYMAACSETIKLGSTVIILPYRNPVVQAKMFASLDVLTHGRMICGVGVGWLEKEFETLGVPYDQRGPMSDEFLQIFKVLWTEPNPEFHGKFYNIDGIQFYPKPVQQPHIPIWVGEGTPGGPCAAPPSTATAGIPPGRRPTLWPRTCPIFGSRLKGRAETRPVFRCP